MPCPEQKWNATLWRSSSNSQICMAMLDERLILLLKHAMTQRTGRLLCHFKSRPRMGFSPHIGGLVFGRVSNDCEARETV